MNGLSELIEQLDGTNSTLQKQRIVKQFFLSLDVSEWVYAVALFTGRRPKKLITSTQMRQLAVEISGMPVWLFESCYGIVGDLAETISLVVPSGEGKLSMGLKEMFDWFEIQAEKPDAQRMQAVATLWSGMSSKEIFVFNKMITGSWRVGFSEQNMYVILAELFHLDSSLVAHRLNGKWSAYTHRLDELLDNSRTEDISIPYPFMLANTVEESVFAADVSGFYAEWKWDGIRCQLIRRKGQTFIWSRGAELLTAHFPELMVGANLFEDGTVLDGEIIVKRGGKPGTFKELQTRILKKKPTRRDIEMNPVHFIAYDILEHEYQDKRHSTQEERRNLLSQLFSTVESGWFSLSEFLVIRDWESLKSIRLQAKSVGAEGLMLKRKAGLYTAGRHKGDWWKWKLDPMVLVLTFAMSGHGRRANVYSDYTFGIWNAGELITITKAYSGLNAEEMQQVDSFIRANTIESYGPVRKVKAELVFEIAFEGIEKSKRHKSGFALRFPRIQSWRTDKAAKNADTIENAEKLWNESRSEL